jgi:aryl-alcohol dehydrogenase
LTYARDDDAYLVVASNGGRADPPAWLANLKAEPGCEIQVGRQRIPVIARPTLPDEPDYTRRWAIVNAVDVAWPSVILRIAVIDFSHGLTINDAHSFVMVHVLMSSMIEIGILDYGGFAISSRWVKSRIAGPVDANCTCDDLEEGGETVSASTFDFEAAVVDEKGGPFRIRTVNVTAPRPDEVLVRIVATGVCQTDAHSRSQNYPVPLPVILGHEGAGIVESVGSEVRDIAPGDHVALSFPSCGRCRSCRAGAPANCEQGFELSFGAARLDGSNAYAGSGVHGHFFGQSSFAHFALANERNTVLIPDDIPLTLAGPLGCGMQTGAGAVLNSLHVGAGQSIAVFGTGAVGLAAVMAAKAVGATTIAAVDVNDARLTLAEELGATHLVNGRQQDVGDRLRKIRPGGFDHVLEITAIPAMLALAVEVLGPMGIAALIGGAPAGTTAPIDMNTLLNGGRVLRGIAQGDSVPQTFIPTLVDLYRSGRFPFDRLVRTYEFTDINKAFDATARGDVIKPVLVMDH